MQLVEQHGPNKQLAAAGDDSSDSYELLLQLRSNFNTKPRARITSVCNSDSLVAARCFTKEPDNIVVFLRKTT